MSIAIFTDFGRLNFSVRKKLVLIDKKTIEYGKRTCVKGDEGGWKAYRSR